MAFGFSRFARGVSGLRNFHCDAESLGGSLGLVVVSGELDVATAPELRKLLDDLRENGETEDLLLDFSDVTFMDSSGIGVLVREHRLRCAPLHIVVQASEVTTILRLTGLNRIFALHTTRDEALNDLFAIDP